MVGGGTYSVKVVFRIYPRTEVSLGTKSEMGTSVHSLQLRIVRIELLPRDRAHSYEFSSRHYRYECRSFSRGHLPTSFSRLINDFHL